MYQTCIKSNVHVLAKNVYTEANVNRYAFKPANSMFANILYNILVYLKLLIKEVIRIQSRIPTVDTTIMY